MYTLWFRAPGHLTRLSVNVPDLALARLTWDLLSSKFTMISARP